MFKSRKKKEEVKVKEVKEELKPDFEEKIHKYLQDSSKHLFQRKRALSVAENYEDNYYKVMPYMIDGVVHAVTMSKNKGNISVTVRDTSWVKTANNFGQFKNTVFDQSYIHKSVRQRSSIDMLEVMWSFNKVERFLWKTDIKDKSQLEKEIKRILE